MKKTPSFCFIFKENAYLCKCVVINETLSGTPLNSKIYFFRNNNLRNN